MDHARYRAHFERNEHRPELFAPSTIDDVPPAMRSAVLGALRTFQAGETGEGRIVAQARRGLGATEPDFAEAMRLYIAEEGRHARELGGLVRGLGGRAATALPTASAFRVARRAIGLRTKMAVLAAAEVVGTVAYELVVERARSEALARVLGAIALEERVHLVFQRDYFELEVARQPTPGARRAARALWSTALGGALTGALAVFAVDQRPLLGALGVSPRELVERALEVVSWTLRAEADAAIAAVDAMRASLVAHPVAHPAPPAPRGARASVAPFAPFGWGEPGRTAA